MLLDVQQFKEHCQNIKLLQLIRADSRLAPSQWKTALLCNDVSHWQGANIETALYIFCFIAGKQLAAVPTSEEVTQQSKVLVQEYIYQRLKKQNLLTMKAEIRGATARYSDVSLEIQVIGGELEKLYPDLYSSVSKQVNVTVSTDVIVRKTFASLAEQLFKTSITWGKVVALFSLAGAFAVDCVSEGHPNYVTAVVDSFTEAVRTHLDMWIIRQGGWVSDKKQQQQQQQQ